MVHNFDFHPFVHSYFTIFMVAKFVKCKLLLLILLLLLLSIHPFSIPAFFQFWVSWSLSQLSRGEMPGTPWIGRQPIARLTLKDRQSFTLTHTYGQFRVIN